MSDLQKELDNLSTVVIPKMKTDNKELRELLGKLYDALLLYASEDFSLYVTTGMCALYNTEAGDKIEELLQETRKKLKKRK